MWQPFLALVIFQVRSQVFAHDLDCDLSIPAPKQLGLQMYATTPGPILLFLILSKTPTLKQGLTL
jgi:hypothetical protein